MRDANLFLPRGQQYLSLTLRGTVEMKLVNVFFFWLSSFGATTAGRPPALGGNSGIEMLEGENQGVRDGGSSTVGKYSAALLWRLGGDHTRSGTE
jgi:hypothetical protein